MGFKGNDARSAASKACLSAFLAAWAFFRASSASALVVDLDPFDQSWASLRSSSCRVFAIRASFAAAFYSIILRVLEMGHYLCVPGNFLCIFAKLFGHGADVDVY